MHKGSYIRSKSALWFLMTIFVPGLICMYWIVAIRQNPELAKSVTTSFMVTYYLTSTMFSALLISHMKDQVARYDIQQGQLSTYLLKPISYYFLRNLFDEVPYRIIQGGYGVIVVLVIAIIFPGFVVYEVSPLIILYTILSSILGYFICYTLEMIFGLIAFWLYDLRLFHSAYDVLFILLGGINMPLFLFPKFLENISLVTPFPSIVYVPTLLVSGKISELDAPMWLMYQVIWLVLTAVLYKATWTLGLKRFTAAGI